MTKIVLTTLLLAIGAVVALPLSAQDKPSDLEILNDWLSSPHAV
jgi:hypothetical protein